MSGMSPTQAAAPAPESANNAAPAPSAPSSGSSNPASNGTTPAPSTGATASSTSSTGQDDSLVCRWADCKEPFTTAELLYVSTSMKRDENENEMKKKKKKFEKSLIHLPGAHLREACWPQEHQQPEPHLPVEPVPHYHGQARPHHLAHPRPCAPQAAQVRLLRQVVQAAPGSQEARQDPCRRLGPCRWTRPPGAAWRHERQLPSPPGQQRCVFLSRLSRPNVRGSL